MILPDNLVTKSFAERLKELREIAGLSQDQLAKYLKVSRGSISYYENAERTPDIEFLDRTGLFFNVPINYLMGYTNTTVEQYELANLRLGLSDKSIQKLENDVDNELVSQIIEHNNFEDFVRRFSEYIEMPKFYNVHFNTDKFIRYELTTLFLEILEDIKTHNDYMQLTDDDLKKRAENYDAIKERYLDAIKEAGKNSFKDTEAMLNSEEYKIRKKVGQALAEAENGNGKHVED